MIVESERTKALDIAEKVLERSHADPDEDIVVLARQLKRAQEEIDFLRTRAGAITGGESYDDLKRRAGPLQRE